MAAYPNPVLGLMELFSALAYLLAWGGLGAILAWATTHRRGRHRHPFCVAVVAEGAQGVSE